jgi:hypothetical protein
VEKIRERNRGDPQNNDRVDPHLQVTGVELGLANVVEGKSKRMLIYRDADNLWRKLSPNFLFQDLVPFSPLCLFSAVPKFVGGKHNVQRQLQTGLGILAGEIKYTRLLDCQSF